MARGKFVRFEKAAGKGLGICPFLSDSQYEAILYANDERDFAVEGSPAVALDREERQLGPAQLRWTRGLIYVLPVTNAFSYR